MEISFDPAKRAATLLARGLDFADAAEVLEGTVVERADDRFDYGETRIVTIGFLRGRLVAVAWTERVGGPHIISMRQATRSEQDDYFRRVG